MIFSFLKMDEKKETIKQLFRPPNSRLIYSHITAKYVNQIWQMDLLDVSIYAGNNNNVNWLLTIVDVYSRYAMMYPLKNKEAITIAEQLRAIFKLVKPDAITSDNEFDSGPVRAVMREFDVRLFLVAKGDHRVLGLIDRFHRTFRKKMTLFMNLNNTTRYIDHLSDIVDEYNRDPHKTLRTKDNVKMKPENVYVNGEKPHRYYYQYKLVKYSKFPKLNDFVRIMLDIGTFDKRTTTQRWSSEVYQIIGVNGIGVEKYQLENIETGEILPKLYRPYQLQVIPKPKQIPESLASTSYFSSSTSPQLSPSIQPVQQEIRKERQKKKNLLELRREDIRPENIVSSKRQRKVPEKLKEYELTRK